MHQFHVIWCVKIFTSYSESNELKIEIDIFRTGIRFSVNCQRKFWRIHSPATWSDSLRKRAKPLDFFNSFELGYCNELSEPIKNGRYSSDLPSN